MHLLKIIFCLIVLVAVIEAQKGGVKGKRPANVPTSPSGRKTPQPTKQQPQPQRPQPQRPTPQRPQEPQDEEGNAGNAIEEPESGPEPPAVIPQTSFTCDDKQYNPGMYADMEVDCSVYHMCFDGRKESFLCGTGTMFNQEILSCDHPAKVNCANSPQYYDKNEELGKPGVEPGPGNQVQSGSKGQSTAIQRPQQPRIQPQQPRAQPQQPRVQPQRPSKVSQPKSQPKPFEDDEEEEAPEAPAPAPAPVPAPRKRPSKTSQPRPQPQKPAPRKQPAPQPRRPIEQSNDDSEDEPENSRRAYRARY